MDEEMKQKLEYSLNFLSEYAAEDEKYVEAYGLVLGYIKSLQESLMDISEKTSTLIQKIREASDNEE